MPTPPSPRRIIEVADGFWNLRGSFKIGPLDIGTQASLVRRPGGTFVLLDACAFDEPTRAWLDERTRGGERLEAVIHLHPFHTLHVAAAHELFPRAHLYGTARHVARLAALPWQPLRTEDPAFHRLYADDFDFMVPRGVDFIADDPKLHFSSVLAFHKPTRTLHVDDTLLYMKLPWLLRPFGRDLTRLHPTLRKVLERRPGAAGAFRAWAAELVERTRDVENLCAAHSAVLLGRDNRGASIASRIERAVQRAEGVLRAHERKHA